MLNGLTISFNYFLMAALILLTNCDITLRPIDWAQIGNTRHHHFFGIICTYVAHTFICPHPQV